MVARQGNFDGTVFAGAPILRCTRGGLVDAVHRGSACVADGDGRIVWRAGEPGGVFFLRSAAKPMHCLAMVEAGAADAFGLDAGDLAVICGSHGGTPAAMGRVRSVLDKIGADPSALACGDGLADQCSGNHAGMLAGAKHLGYPWDGYGRPDHPVQARIREAVAALAGWDPADVPVAGDGCSAPTQALSVAGAARAYARLGGAGGGLPARRVRACAAIAAALAAHPGELTGEPDWAPWLAPGNTVVTKAGAGGVFCAAWPQAGLGFALKVEDGSPLPRWPVFAAVMERLGLFLPGSGRDIPRALGLLPADRRGRVLGEVEALV